MTDSTKPTNAIIDREETNLSFDTSRLSVVKPAASVVNSGSPTYPFELEPIAEEFTEITQVAKAKEINEVTNLTVDPSVDHSSEEINLPWNSQPKSIREETAATVDLVLSKKKKDDKAVLAAEEVISANPVDLVKETYLEISEEDAEYEYLLRQAENLKKELSALEAFEGQILTEEDEKDNYYANMPEHDLDKLLEEVENHFAESKKDSGELTEEENEYAEEKLDELLGEAEKLLKSIGNDDDQDKEQDEEDDYYAEMSEEELLRQEKYLSAEIAKKKLAKVLADHPDAIKINPLELSPEDNKKLSEFFKIKKQDHYKHNYPYSFTLHKEDGTEQKITLVLTKSVLRRDRKGNAEGSRYEVIDKANLLGAGAFGKVLHTTTLEPTTQGLLANGKHKRVVKIQVHDPKEETEEQFKQRIIKEVELSQQLNHLHAKQVIFTQGKDGSLKAKTVMHFLKGDNLQKIIDAQDLSTEQRLALTEKLFAALTELKTHKIVHRDIKPENIIVEWIGKDEPIVKLLDLGLAKKEEEKILRSDGSLAFMSLEALSAQNATYASDLYSMALVVAELWGTSQEREFINSKTNEILKFSDVASLIKNKNELSELYKLWLIENFRNPDLQLIFPDLFKGIKIKDSDKIAIKDYLEKLTAYVPAKRGSCEEAVKFFVEKKAEYASNTLNNPGKILNNLPEDEQLTQNKPLTEDVNPHITDENSTSTAVADLLKAENDYNPNNLEKAFGDILADFDDLFEGKEVKEVKEVKELKELKPETQYFQNLQRIEELQEDLKNEPTKIEIEALRAKVIAIRQERNQHLGDKQRLNELESAAVQLTKEIDQHEAKVQKIENEIQQLKNNVVEYERAFTTDVATNDIDENNPFDALLKEIDSAGLDDLPPPSEASPMASSAIEKQADTNSDDETLIASFYQREKEKELFEPKQTELENLEAQKDSIKRELRNLANSAFVAGTPDQLVEALQRTKLAEIECEKKLVELDNQQIQLKIMCIEEVWVAKISLSAAKPQQGSLNGLDALDDLLADTETPDNQSMDLTDIEKELQSKLKEFSEEFLAQQRTVLVEKQETNQQRLQKISVEEAELKTYLRLDTQTDATVADKFLATSDEEKRFLLEQLQQQLFAQKEKIEYSLKSCEELISAREDIDLPFNSDAAKEAWKAQTTKLAELVERNKKSDTLPQSLVRDQVLAEINQCKTDKEREQTQLREATEKLYTQLKQELSEAIAAKKTKLTQQQKQLTQFADFLNDDELTNSAKRFNQEFEELTKIEVTLLNVNAADVQVTATDLSALLAQHKQATEIENLNKLQTNTDLLRENSNKLNIDVSKLQKSLADLEFLNTEYEKFQAEYVVLQKEKNNIKSDKEYVAQLVKFHDRLNPFKYKTNIEVASPTRSKNEAENVISDKLAQNQTRLQGKAKVLRNELERLIAAKNKLQTVIAGLEEYSETRQELQAQLDAIETKLGSVKANTLMQQLVELAEQNSATPNNSAHPESISEKIHKKLLAERNLELEKIRKVAKGNVNKERVKTELEEKYSLQTVAKLAEEHAQVNALPKPQLAAMSKEERVKKLKENHDQQKAATKPVAVTIPAQAAKKASSASLFDDSVDESDVIGDIAKWQSVKTDLLAKIAKWKTDNEAGITKNILYQKERKVLESLQILINDLCDTLHVSEPKEALQILHEGLIIQKNYLQSEFEEFRKFTKIVQFPDSALVKLIDDSIKQIDDRIKQIGSVSSSSESTLANIKNLEWESLKSFVLTDLKRLTVPSSESELKSDNRNEQCLAKQAVYERALTLVRQLEKQLMEQKINPDKAFEILAGGLEKEREFLNQIGRNAALFKSSKYALVSKGFFSPSKENNLSLIAEAIDKALNRKISYSAKESLLLDQSSLLEKEYDSYFAEREHLVAPAA